MKIFATIIDSMTPLEFWQFQNDMKDHTAPRAERGSDVGRWEWFYLLRRCSKTVK